MSVESKNKQSTEESINPEKLDQLDASLSSARDSRKANGRKKMLMALVPFVAIVFFIAAIFAWQYFDGREETEDAYIDGHTSAISARVSGTVTDVYVTDNQVVKAGDLIAQLDSRDYEAKVEQSKAQVQLMQGQLDQSIASRKQATKNADAQITQATSDRDVASANVEFVTSAVSQSIAAVNEQKSEVKSLAAKLSLTRNDYERYLELDTNDAVSKQELDQKRTDYEVAGAQLQAAKDRLKQAELKVIQSRAQVSQAKAEVVHSYGLIEGAEATQEQINVINKQIASANASLEQALAQLKQDLLKLSYCEIKAPLTGRIGRKNLEIGNHVEIGQNLISIVGSDSWITANFKETQTARMHSGQEVEISVDGLPGAKLKGHVDSLSPASGAKFALLPPENATGNFTKVVQRIPVKIVFDGLSSSNKLRLVPGMSCLVTVLVKQDAHK